MPALDRAFHGEEFIRLAINPSKGSGHWDILRLGDEVVLCVAKGVYANLFTYTVCPPSDIVTIRMLVTGEIEISGQSETSTHFDRGTASIATVPGGMAQELSILEREPLASLTVHIRAGCLSRLMGLEKSELPSMLAPFEQTDGEFKSCTMPLTVAMANGVLDLVNAPYRGAIRRRFFEAKSMELLCQLVDAAARSSATRTRPESLRRGDIARAHEARRILDESPAATPSVSELARRVGTNRTQIRMAFKGEFGVTISDYIFNNRMEIARELLKNEALSIHAISEFVGYQYPSNFAAAFRRHFGILPKVLRK